MARFILRGKGYSLERKDVENAVKGEDPGPIQKYSVTVNNREFPIKQVVRLLTGLNSAEFTAHDAYRVLRKIGFGITSYD